MNILFLFIKDALNCSKWKDIYNVTKYSISNKFSFF